MEQNHKTVTLTKINTKKKNLNDYMFAEVRKEAEDLTRSWGVSEWSQVHSYTPNTGSDKTLKRKKEEQLVRSKVKCLAMMLTQC